MTDKALRAKIADIAENLIDQRAEPWPNGTESDRLHYWRDKAIKSARALKAALDE